MPSFVRGIFAGALHDSLLFPYPSPLDRRDAAEARVVRRLIDDLRQMQQEGLIDSLHLAIRPVLLGRGENLFNGLDLRALGYETEKSVPGERATHVYLRKAR